MSKSNNALEKPERIESITDLNDAFKTQDKILLSRLSPAMKDSVTSGRFKNLFIRIKIKGKEYIKKTSNHPAAHSTKPPCTRFSPHIVATKK